MIECRDLALNNPQITVGGSWDSFEPERHGAHIFAITFILLDRASMTWEITFYR